MNDRNTKFERMTLEQLKEHIRQLDETLTECTIEPSHFVAIGSIDIDHTPTTRTLH